MADGNIDQQLARIEARLDGIETVTGQLRIDLVRLEAKIDSKPSLMAMFTGIVVVAGATHEIFAA